MRRLFAIAVLAACISSALISARATSQGGPGSTPGQPPPPMGGPRMMSSPPDSFAVERDSMMNAVLDRIAGREGMAAESVFKNIKVMKGVPAGRLLRIMNMGFSRSLGVSCKHCHVPGHWADEDKKQKQIARDMMAMVRVINDEQLAKIKNIQSEHPTVNCNMCHRGQARPGTDGRPAPPRPEGTPSQGQH